MLNDETINFQAPKIKLTLEVNRNSVDCVKIVCSNLEIKYEQKNNSKFPNLVIFEFYVNIAEAYWLGRKMEQCETEKNINHNGNN